MAAKVKLKKGSPQLLLSLQKGSPHRNFCKKAPLIGIFQKGSPQLLLSLQNNRVRVIGVLTGIERYFGLFRVS